MKNLIGFLCFGCLFIACNPTTSTKTPPETEDNTIEVPSLTSFEGKHCFLETIQHKDMIIMKGDTIFFIDSIIVNLEIAGNKVTGTMDWIPAQKDSARGTLEGTIDGNTVTALYSYTIEGNEQAEEKIFEIRENGLAVKVGELAEDQNMVLRLKDPEGAEFKELVPRVSCD